MPSQVDKSQILHHWCHGLLLSFCLWNNIPYFFCCMMRLLLIQKNPKIHKNINLYYKMASHYCDCFRKEICLKTELRRTDLNIWCHSSSGKTQFYSQINKYCAFKQKYVNYTQNPSALPQPPLSHAWSEKQLPYIPIIKTFTQVQRAMYMWTHTHAL